MAVETSEWPTKRVGASALIFNGRGDILLVKSSYKPYWSLPGGIVEENEAPSAACVREVFEEVGLQVSEMPCLCVLWSPRQGAAPDTIRFAFLGGTLSTEAATSIRGDSDGEVERWQFVSVCEAAGLLSDSSRRLLRASLMALGDKKLTYVECV